jgi:hypothetical protein
MLRNISRSYMALASQLEMLADDIVRERRRQPGHEH